MNLELSYRKTPLGEGGFTEISYDEILEDRLEESVRVAIKAHPPMQRGSLETHRTSSIMISQVFAKICVMKHLSLENYENILKMFDVSDVSSRDTLQLSFITEYVDLGSLGSYLCENMNQMKWAWKAQIHNDVGAGLAALHNCKIVHNDVKCGNILLFSDSTSE